MLGALEYILVPAIGVLVWHETRVFGQRRDDRDWIEAAPAIAGLAVFAGYVLGGELATPVQPVGFTEPSVWEIRRWVFTRAVMYGSIVMSLLIAFEAALADEGYIEQEWRLFGERGDDG